jgi:hypothetical protein
MKSRVNYTFDGQLGTTPVHTADFEDGVEPDLPDAGDLRSFGGESFVVVSALDPDEQDGVEIYTVKIRRK